MKTTVKELRRIQKKDIARWKQVLSPIAARQLEDKIARRTLTFDDSEEIETGTERFFEVSNGIPRGQVIYEMISNELIKDKEPEVDRRLEAIVIERRFGGFLPFFRFVDGRSEQAAKRISPNTELALAAAIEMKSKPALNIQWWIGEGE